MRYLYILLSYIFLTSTYAQSGKILHDLHKLNAVGTALYIAAHPDDENTRLIAYLSNHEKLRTVYLSLTRGDGGQNLIGPELREQLGLIRTHELLQARSVDGGQQFFSRANDFGYSKTPEEALSIWNKEEVLADVVWAIRVHRPDIIVNRFNHEHNGRTHGHHTASAMLSYEAFDMAGDPKAFPEQLKYVDTWQPKRLFFNTSWWFYGSREKFMAADKSNMAELDVGQYYPLLGLSNNEISAASRSMHKCQGFGSATGRGSYMEYLNFLKGDRPKDKNNIVDGISTGWARLEGGEVIQDQMTKVLADFDPTAPHAIVPDLIALRRNIQQLKNEHWRSIKTEQLDDIIVRCLGLFVRAESSVANISPGEKLSWALEIVNRSPISAQLTKISSQDLDVDTTMNTILADNLELILELDNTLNTTSSSSPYWLQDSSSLGMYTVTNQEDRGKPLLKGGAQISIELEILNEKIILNKEVEYVRVDPVEGELSDPIKIVPEVYMNFSENTNVFRPNESKTIDFEITSNAAIDSAQIILEAASDWLVQCKEEVITLSEGQIKNISLTVTAPGIPGTTPLLLKVKTPSKTYSTGIVNIKYDHIPAQQIEKSSETKLICIDVKTVGYRIGYIEGAGDLVDESLKNIGYQVEHIALDQLNLQSIQKFDAIIMGIRSFNTEDELEFKNKVLFEYVKNGGNLIVQYNTRHRLKTKDIAPYSIKLSRKRVTDEFAPITIINPDHEVMTEPNKITKADFENWVQERGLYFPDEWSDEFKPILSMSDQGEEALTGGLLVAPYGEGNYIYSSLSYFRQLPVGVPGPYRLLANMIALGKNDRP